MRVALIFLLPFFLVSSSLAQEPSRSEQDGSLKGAIEHELMDEDIRTVQVEVTDGSVTLTGTVDTAWEKQQAEEIALGHREVTDVVNEIGIESDRSDQAVAEDVARKIRNYVHYGIFDDVNVRALDGVVTLTGKVTWGYKAEELAKMASRVPGVERVENEIEVLPTSSNDEQLRATLASRIYGDSLFQRYSTQASPPIHIIVDRGHVTLTGIVASPVEKRMAGHIARGTFGVFSVDNQLRVASESSD